ncbi:MAG: hypothetical protein DRO67_08520 [Candidatus Asgardarchaeum californiense]|nr:MAG: hypothetical protein DRO67_08520 [Candidatus Asgardarchaeum californiense]
MYLKLSFYDSKGRMVQDVTLLPTTEFVARKIVGCNTFNQRMTTYLDYAKLFEDEHRLVTGMKLTLQRWADDYEPIFYLA